LTRTAGLGRVIQHQIFRRTTYWTAGQVATTALAVLKYRAAGMCRATAGRILLVVQVRSVDSLDQTLERRRWTSAGRGVVFGFDRSAFIAVG